MAARSAVYLVLIAVLAPWIYDRYQTLVPLLANRPGKMQEINHFKSHDVLFRDQVRNCEDAVLDEESGVAFLSCDAGRDRWNTVMGHFHPTPSSLPNGLIYIYNYASRRSKDETPQALKLLSFPAGHSFHPLGLDFDAKTSTLYVVNHATSGPTIETFHIDLSSRTAKHLSTLTHPLLYAPNSIQLLPNGNLYVTNDHYFTAKNSKLLSQLESWIAPPIASVVYVSLLPGGAGVQDVKTVARLPFANGIVLLNSTTLAVASCSKTGIYFYTLTPEYDLLLSKGYIRVPAAVDNLSLDKKSGKLLMAGHPFAPAVFEVSEKRAAGCDVDSEGCECDAPSWVAEWSEEGGLRELYKGSGICSSTTAVRDGGRGVGIVVGLYDRGIMVFE